ncbi:MAG: hypothetical protein HKN34_10380 [Gammaproteobacteria bacterium]|nr:hypothetical protein [Gammaproteobacteria bacterium]
MRRILLCIALAGFNVNAQQSDPEWPCIQVLVPEINLAVLWPQSIDVSAIDNWRNDPEIARIVERLSDLEAFTETEQKIIAEFIEPVIGNERSDILNRLAVGILQNANQLRAQYIRGIKRYTRQQISIASQIENKLNQLSGLDGQNNAQTAEIEETLRWHQRVYDQREQAIQALCERPVEAEEKLSQVLRELAQYLP